MFTEVQLIETFIGGFLLGSLITYIFSYRPKKEKKEQDLN